MNTTRIKARFEEKLAPPNEQGCREWLAGRNARGYGNFRVGTRSVNAHRFAYVQAHGEPPLDKPHVLHSCDNPACCELSHLRAGSREENMADMKARGRDAHPRGESHGSAKLSAADVKTIRRLYRPGVSQRQLGSAFGVSHVQIGRIVNGEEWK